MTITTLLDRLAGWLGAQAFDPPLRSISLGGPQPPLRFPHCSIVLESEVFNAPADPGDTSFRLPRFNPRTGSQQHARANLSLRLSLAGGRPELLLADCRSLAHQVRRSLLHSAVLGGAGRILDVPGIRYAEAHACDHVIQSAGLSVVLLYIE